MIKSSIDPVWFLFIMNFIVLVFQKHNRYHLGQQEPSIAQESMQLIFCYYLYHDNYFENFINEKEAR